MSRVEGLELRRPPGRTPMGVDDSAIPESDRQLVVLERRKPRIWGSFKLTLVFLMSIGIAIAMRTMSDVRKENIDPLDYRTRTDRILSQTPLIDGHNDLPFLIRLQLNNQIYENKLPFGQG